MRRLFILGVAGILSGFCPVLAENSGGNDSGGDSGKHDIVCAIQPPDGAEIQKWEFCYDHFLVCQAWPAWRDEGYLEYQNLVKSVDCVIDGGFIYFRGVSMVVPEFWIRGELTGEYEIVFPNGQLLGSYKNTPDGVIREIYFTPAIFGENSDDSNRWFWMDIIATPTLKDFRCLYERHSGIIIPYSQTAQGAKGYFYYGDFGFSFSPEKNEPVIGGYIREKDTGDTEYHYKDMYVNVSFRKAVSGDVDEITGDAGEEDTSVYDLSGRKVDAESLSPGIYIRGGKKVVIRN